MNLKNQNGRSTERRMCRWDEDTGEMSSSTPQITEPLMQKSWPLFPCQASRYFGLLTEAKNLQLKNITKQNLTRSQMMEILYAVPYIFLAPLIKSLH
jgi:hypothetical protein